MGLRVKLFIATLLLLLVTNLAGGAAFAPTHEVVPASAADWQVSADRLKSLDLRLPTDRQVSSDRQVSVGSFAYSRSQEGKSYSDGEMALSSLLEAFVQSNQFRARRVSHFSELFKISMYKLCLLYKRAELADKYKISDAYTPVRNKQTCSDYFIFALRRILI